MSLINDLNYIYRVSGRLNRFSKKKDTLFNFRCSICGDSHKDLTKKRGFFFPNKKNNGYTFTCHNCSSSMSFGNWLKQFDHSLYQDYIFDLFEDKRSLNVDKPVDKDYDLLAKASSKPIFNRGSKNETNETTSKTRTSKSSTTLESSIPDAPIMQEIESVSSIHDEHNEDELSDLSGSFTFKPNFGKRKTESLDQDEIPVFSECEDDAKCVKRPNMENLRKISHLADNHGAKKYLRDRMIPESFFDKLYIVWKFCAWCNEWKPDSFSDYMVENYDEPRLIIPFYDESGKLMMIQGRSFKKDAKIRYFSIKCDDDFPKIYGLERVDKSKIVQIWEGPIDSMFGDNACAMAGADADAKVYFTDYVKIYDNEPRNPDICKRINRAIKDGEKVVIWPRKIPEKYDGNDMIKNLGLSVKQLNDIIEKNTFSGLEAELEFAKWTRSNIKRKSSRRNNKPQFNF